MALDTEISRFDSGTMGFDLPSARWECVIYVEDSETDVLRKIMSVAEGIIKSDPDNWPDDNQWRAELPEWLRQSMMTLEEAQTAMARTPREQWDKLPWEFGSWLDAMRERGWRWWGQERLGDKARIVLELIDMPPRVEAFKQLVIASGAKLEADHYIGL